ncbi:hypothetical protein [Pseudomonas entomophila]|uniref:Uncharacterized protein n=2 Tax=Pseudomonas entomophila TaxID=312306 RepID=Q1I673_PSEE4|nr:hypothetical protein [Pseudomonas entomophila]WMW07406.1 hypothetical protein RAH46_08695 [Pseudomonas entomophila]CAK16862.1 conserved hypothetical protein [Pseudomonas entomophila L48]
MIINLVPVRHDQPLALSVKGDVLTLNGEAFDFRALGEGALLPVEAIAAPWFMGDVRRIEGRLHLTLMLPHGVHAPQATRFPEALEVTEDGPVALPPYETPMSEERRRDEH